MLSHCDTWDQGGPVFCLIALLLCYLWTRFEPLVGIMHCALVSRLLHGYEEILVGRMTVT